MALFLLALALAAAAPDPDTIVVTARLPTDRPVPDAVLATMRGGVRLPNGLDVAIGIDIQTRVDGLLALHTLYASEGATPGLRVFTDGRDAPSAADGTTVVSDPGAAVTPTLIVARAPTGPVIVPGRAAQPVAVNLLAGGAATWLTADGQKQVPVAIDGPPVPAETGTVQAVSAPGGTTVTLDADALRIQHLIGRATGVVVANTGSDRAIDSVTTVNVDLAGLSPVTMGAIFAVQRAAMDAVRGR